MADIFGYTPQDYPQLKRITDDGGDYKQYIRDSTAEIPVFRNNPEGSARPVSRVHNFNVKRQDVKAANASFAVPMVEQAAVGPDPLGFFTSNLTAFQAQIERVLYREYMLAEWVPIKTDIPEGANSTGFAIQDFQGSTSWISDDGSDAPSVSTSLSSTSYPLYVSGNIAKYTDEQIRNAMHINLPLTTTLIEQAVMEDLWFMEDKALNGEMGTNTNWRGLLNQPTRDSATDTPAGNVIRENINLDFTADATDAKEIARKIVRFIGAMKNDSKGLLGRRVGGRLMLGLPPSRNLIVQTETLDDKGSDISIAEHIQRHNTWVGARPGNTIEFVEMDELETANTGSTPLMVAWVNNPAVMEFAVSIQPRVKDRVRSYFGEGVPTEAKHAPALYVKYAWGMRYGYGI